jgi:hypothetical protein
MHPVYILAFATFACVVAFVYWNRLSAKRHKETGGNTSGIGGPNDPLSGKNDALRSPAEMTASMEAAAARQSAMQPPAEARENAGARTS